MEQENNRKDNNKGSDRFKLTELFMARAGRKNWERCFYGSIRRENNRDGNEIAVYGKINVNDGVVWTMAENQDELGKRLDTLVLMVLDYNLHGVMKRESEIACSPFNLN